MRDRGVPRACLAATLALLVAAVPASAEPLLPDLDPRSPAQITIRSVGAEDRLGFASRVTNRGAGPLVIQGARPDTSQPLMTAAQVIDESNGSTSARPGVGQLEYTVNPDHAHWHLLDFERYELRRAEDHAVAAIALKRGFCLVDSYQDDRETLLPGEPGGPEFFRPCGQNEPDLLTLTEGISVGFGDFYPAHLEGQSLDVRGLPPGSYELVHVADPAAKLAQQRTDNDSSSVLLQLAREPGGPTQVEVLRSCPDTAACAAPEPPPAPPPPPGPPAPPAEPAPAPSTEPATTPGPVNPGSPVPVLPFRPATPGEAPRLELDTARRWTRLALERRHRTKRLLALRRSCRRQTISRVRCVASWRTRRGARRRAQVDVRRVTGGTLRTSVRALLPRA